MRHRGFLFPHHIAHTVARELRMTTSDPFDDPRIQGVINGLARHLGIDPATLTIEFRGERRGGGGETTQPLSVPGSPASGDGEQE